jgi:hypothetical protein
MQGMLLELRCVLAALEQASVSVIVLKGAALAHVFGKPRFFSDLDVLVPRSDLDRATAELESLGYVAGRVTRSSEFYERHHFHRVLRSPAGITLELHWALVRPSDYFSLEPEGVRSRAQCTAFDGGAMHVPCHSDQLLHAAQQALREGFSDARRVLDADLLLRAGAADDPDLAARARLGGLSNSLWVLLSLTGSITGLGAPDLREALRPTRLRQRSLEALDLPALLLERRSVHLTGLTAWLLLLCAPGMDVAGRALGRAIFPGERGLLEDGYVPEKPPGPLHRARLSMKRMGRTVKLAAYQTWRLCAHRRAPS